MHSDRPESDSPLLRRRERQPNKFARGIIPPISFISPHAGPLQQRRLPTTSHRRAAEPVAETGFDFLRHGGDFQGIIDHLDYLQTLGRNDLMEDTRD